MNLYILKNEIINSPLPSLRVFYKMRQLFIKCIENLEVINYKDFSNPCFIPSAALKSKEKT